MTPRLSVVAFVALVACAPGRRVTAHDGSVAEHERAAEYNDELAATHADAAAKAEPCGDAPGIYEICWTRSDTPSAHTAMAQRHRQWAEVHRRAAEELREAEAAACEGVTEGDRDTSPFQRTADIAQVEVLRGETGDDPSLVPVARVTFRDVARMDAERLDHILGCHIARNAALGHEVPHMNDCPLVPKGVHAATASTPTGVVVTISAPQASLVEVTSRAEALRRRLGQD